MDKFFIPQVLLRNRLLFRCHDSDWLESFARRFLDFKVQYSRITRVRIPGVRLTDEPRLVKPRFVDQSSLRPRYRSRDLPR